MESYWLENALRLFFILAQSQTLVLCQNESVILLVQFWLSYVRYIVTWLLIFGLVYINIALLLFQMHLHFLSLSISTVYKDVSKQLCSDSCVPLPTGSHWRLYIHKQRLWPVLSQPSRQDGELLPGWDAQILLPAVFRGPRPYQLRQVRLQHWGPSSAHMATSRVMDPQAHVRNQTHLSQGREHIWNPNCRLFLH